MTACQKIPHRTKRDAERALRALWRAQDERGEKRALRLEVYRCPRRSCDHAWHLGHRPA